MNTALQNFLNRDFENNPQIASRRVDKAIRFLINKIDMKTINTQKECDQCADTFEILFGIKEVFDTKPGA